MADLLTSAKTVIREVLEEGGRACLTCSFQSEDVAVLDLLLEQKQDVDVLFLDTGYHFEAVYAYRDRIAERYGIQVRSLTPLQTVAEQEAEFGLMYRSDPAQCCHRRKVEPLMAGLAGYEAWFTGLRREQSPTRANLQPKEKHAFPNGLALEKVSPLFDWTMRDVEAYLVARDIPRLGLYEEGYLSIGCEPCTSRPDPGEHSRSGRWGGRKLECGLHTVTVKEG